MTDTTPPLRNLKGLGARSEDRLLQAGIKDADHLRELGAVSAFLRLEQAGLKPSLNFLYALEGALRGCHWTHAAQQFKTQLLTELQAAREFDILKGAETTDTAEPHQPD